MSRRVAVALYEAIVKLRPNWHSTDDSEGFVKVVMTGSATDPEDFQQHIRSGERRRRIGEEFKKPETPVKLAIVCDMWLTGFDVPCLHTMYIDKPLQGHGLCRPLRG